MRLIMAALLCTCLTIAGCGDASTQTAAQAKHVMLTADNFDDVVLQSDRPVVVDFWAPWCDACVAFSPTIHALADEYAGRAVVGKLNFDDNRALFETYDVQSIPTVLVFKDGQVVGRTGSASRNDIESILAAHLPPADEQTVRAGP